MQRALAVLKEILPAPLFSFYHLALAYTGALLYGFPSKRLIVIGVTGTKGKSSTAEFLNAIYEAAGHKTALLNSIRIKIDADSEPNYMRMSMPGRFYIQRFLAHARKDGCTVAILEMTSEGARQHRHRAISMNGLVFTNLAPEHIESHGSYQAYADAKLSIGHELVRSNKQPRIMVARADDNESSRYLSLPVERPIPFSLEEASPWSATERGGFFTFKGTRIPVHVAGEFSLLNALAAAHMADALGVSTSAIARGCDSLTRIPGRAEEIIEGQDFSVVVDYAHTPDSLQALYTAYGTKRKICVLGSMGGGRDTWKRPVMGEIADTMCDEVILTNEDPCDENPQSIIDMLASQMKRSPDMILDRREAIRVALSRARSGDAVLISGKGTDTSIKGPNGTSTPWSDASVAREELQKLLSLSQ